MGNAPVRARPRASPRQSPRLAEAERCRLGHAAPADLVDHARHVHVVVDEPPALGPARGHREERDALDTRRRAIDARQRQVDDVLGEVVVAARDEDLGAADEVSAALGAGVARVFTSARLLPACGSVSAMVPVHSPL